MKKVFMSLLAIAALSTTSLFAQSSPFEWQVGDNTKIKLGGYVQLNINSDIDGSVGGGKDFISTNIVESNWANEDYFLIDPSSTRLTLEINQTTESLGNIKFYIETDFRGSNVRLRQAYVESKGFIAGQAWSFMADLAANAPTIDINGVGSRTFLRTPLFGYRHNFTKNLSGGISIETPSINTKYAANYSSVTQSVPNIPIYLQLKGAAGHIKAGAMFNTLQYAKANKWSTDTEGNTTVVDAERMSEMGIGGQLSGSLKASKIFTLYGQAIYGKGISNFISNLAGLSVGLMSTDDVTMEATPMGGASLGIGAKFNSKWSAAASGSVVENYGDEDFFAGEFQTGTYLSTTLFYAPAPRMTLGLEFLNGSRTNFGGDAIGAKRLSFSVKYLL